MDPSNNNLRKDVAYAAVKNETGYFHSEENEPVPKIGARHGQLALYFFLLLLGYGARVILSVAIVAMTDPSTNANSDIPTYPEWTQKGAILSAFFWGYIWPQAFAGWAANRFGAKWFLVTTMGAQSFLCACSPFIAATLGQTGLMATRALQGFAQGFLIPTLAHGVSQWVPPQERATLSNATLGAIPLGIVLALFVTGFLAATSYGWPLVFYLYGMAGIFWCVMFSFFGYNSPAEHPHIGQAEKYFIEKNLGHLNEKPSHKVPWKSILTSVPVYALLVAQCGWIFGFWILLTQIPSYMNHVMNFDIKQNSVLSSTPYFIQFVLALIVGVVSDFIINRGYVGQTRARKMFHTIGNVLSAVALVLLAYTRSDEPYKAVWWLVVAIGSSSISNAGWSVNPMDLSPNYTGTLVGVCNGVSNILSIFAPLMVQILVDDEKNADHWKSVFFVAACTYIFSAVIFAIFGTADLQTWNENEEKDENEERKIKTSI